jgi:hypothetical protein
MASISRSSRGIAAVASNRSVIEVTVRSLVSTLPMAT